MSSLRFCAKPPGGAPEAAPPPASPAISEKSKVGEKDTSVNRTLPRSRADCDEPVSVRLVLSPSRTPCGKSVRIPLPATTTLNCSVGLYVTPPVAVSVPPLMLPLNCSISRRFVVSFRTPFPFCKPIGMSSPAKLASTILISPWTSGFARAPKPFTFNRICPPATISGSNICAMLRSMVPSASSEIGALPLTGIVP